MTRRGPSDGFTLLELLLAMALFSILGVAVVALLSQGLTLFREGSADTRMQDRLASVAPMVRDDLLAILPAQAPEVPPPPVSEEAAAQAAASRGEPPAPPPPPALRLRSGWLKLKDLPSEWPPVYYCAFVRTNAREGEDPLLRKAGTAGAAPGVPLRAYDPPAIDSGQRGNLLAPGGLLEVVWIAVPEDPDPLKRKAPPEPGSHWPAGVLTLYRLFRAPAGGDGSLLDPARYDSLAKVRALGRPIAEGLIHFSVTFRNLFATSWEDGRAAGRVEDGAPYVGEVWDSTRGADKAFAFYSGPESLGSVRDDVFPARARVEVVLANPSAGGYLGADTRLSEPATADERKVTLESVDPLFVRGAGERHLKVDWEWMATTLDLVDVASRRVTVSRARRGTPAAAHEADAPVRVGVGTAVDVPLVWKDRYARRR